MRTTRRQFLRGLGGVSLGLPLLESLDTRPAWAAGRPPVYGCFIVNMNGVQQAGFGGEPERFWPRALGPLSRAALEANSDRTLSELKDHAERLILVRGIRFPFPGSGCSHSGGGNQVLTAARVSDVPSRNKSLAMGESVDNRIARELGREPLALYAGPKGGYINDHISFRGPRDVRVAENNPALAYQKIIGMNAAATPDLAQRLAARRMSVNDLVREEMKELLARKDLSASDRQRLQTHFEHVREIEVKISATLPAETVTALKAVDGRHRSNTTRLQVERLHMDLIVFAFATGLTPVAYLQCGDGTDGMEHEWMGTRYPRFHLVSHRASSDSAVNDGTMPDAVNQHHNIDRINARQFKYLLDRLAATPTPEGSLLDVGFAVWTNQIATGNHNYHNVPYVIAGRARGFFRTGQYVSASGTTSASSSGNQTNNKILNVFINAFGIRKPSGELVDDFGDPGLAKGVLPSIMNA